MLKHKKKVIVGILTTVISSLYGITIITGGGNADPIHNEIPAISNHNEIILQFGQAYNLQDGYKVEITIDKFNRKRVVFMPGEK